jgi:hypothetical protein
MKNAMNVVPGEFVANGHDYRADLAQFVREVYNLPCSEEQMQRIEDALRQYELLRQEKFDRSTAEPAEETAESERAAGITHIGDHRAAA